MNAILAPARINDSGGGKQKTVVGFPNVTSIYSRKIEFIMFDRSCSVDKHVSWLEVTECIYNFLTVSMRSFSCEK